MIRVWKSVFVIGKKKNDASLDDVFSTSSGSRFIDEGAEQNSNNESPVTANDFLNSIDNGINDKPKTEGPLVDSNDVVDISYDSDVPISDENGFDLNDSLSSKNDDDLLPFTAWISLLLQTVYWNSPPAHDRRNWSRSSGCPDPQWRISGCWSRGERTCSFW